MKNASLTIHCVPMQSSLEREGGGSVKTIRKIEGYQLMLDRPFHGEVKYFFTVAYCLNDP